MKLPLKDGEIDVSEKVVDELFESLVRVSSKTLSNSEHAFVVTGRDGETRITSTQWTLATVSAANALSAWFSFFKVPTDETEKFFRSVWITMVKEALEEFGWSGNEENARGWFEEVQFEEHRFGQSLSIKEKEDEADRVLDDLFHQFMDASSKSFEEIRRVEPSADVTTALVTLSLGFAKAVGGWLDMFRAPKGFVETLLDHGEWMNLMNDSPNISLCINNMRSVFEGQHRHTPRKPE